MSAVLRQGDVTRAIRAVMRAGLTVVRVEVEGETVRILTGGPGEAPATATQWLDRLGNGRNRRATPRS